MLMKAIPAWEIMQREAERIFLIKKNISDLVVITVLDSVNFFQRFLSIKRWNWMGRSHATSCVNIQIFQ